MQILQWLLETGKAKDTEIYAHYFHRAINAHPFSMPSSYTSSSSSHYLNDEIHTEAQRWVFCVRQVDQLKLRLLYVYTK